MRASKGGRVGKGLHPTGGRIQDSILIIKHSLLRNHSGAIVAIVALALLWLFISRGRDACKIWLCR